jgi:serine/threonine-protein kinase RsbW
MTPAGRARSWGSAPVALLRLDADGRLLDANETFLAWAGADAPDLRGRRLSDLLTVGGRIYWETHVSPILTLQGRVDEVAVELRTPGATMPVLLSAVARPDQPGPVVDVALFAAAERARFERELVAARADAEEASARLRWVHDATASLARAAGVDGVTDALLSAVARHPSVASAELLDDRAAARVDARGRFVVPLPGGRHGALVVTPHERPGDLPVDPQALATIAQQAAVALDRAVLHERSVSVARELQDAMLTRRLPVRDDVEVLARYRPAASGLDVGGDWYDAFMVDDATLAVAVGDVVGHGLHAATAMGQLRTATRAIARPGVGPAGVLDLVDDFVLRLDVGFAATLVYAELDTRTATWTYACAGHLPPLLVRAGGSAELLWQGRSAPLGVPNPQGPRTQDAVDLAAGDAVVLYTDGVVERRDRTLVDGLDGLVDRAGRRARAGDGVIVEEAGDGRDDACVLQMTWHGARG